MRRLFFIAALLVSARTFAGVGTTGASSLALASGARGQGMGEAFVAVAEGSDSLSWNPAGLSAGAPKSLFAGFQPMAENVSVNQLGGAARIGKFGVGGQYGSVSATKLDAFDTAGNKAGNFDAKDQLLALGGSFGGPAFAAGVTAKFWSSQIGGKSASVAMADVGATFQNPILRSVRHGFALRNLGGTVSYVSQKDLLPAVVVFGTAFKAGRRLLLSGDYGQEKSAGGYFAVGGEWAALTSERFGLAIRGGYNTRRKDAGSISGASVGAGFSWRAVALDYAWVPFGDIGDSHAFTLRMKFGANAEEELHATEHRRANETRVAKRAAPVPATKGKVEATKSLRRRPRTLETIPPR